jgi:hypothetical protein
MVDPFAMCGASLKNSQLVTSSLTYLNSWDHWVVRSFSWPLWVSHLNSQISRRAGEGEKRLMRPASSGASFHGDVLRAY